MLEIAVPITRLPNAEPPGGLSEVAHLIKGERTALIAPNLRDGSKTILAHNII
jgi:hypothetical protein